MKDYISAEEKAEQILDNMDIDFYELQDGKKPIDRYIKCITKGLQEFALGENGPLLIIYKVVLSTAKRTIKNLKKNIMLPPEQFSFEQDEVGEMGVKYYIEGVQTDKHVFVCRADGDSIRPMKCEHLPDKTIIELADYIRNHTK